MVENKKTRNQRLQTQFRLIRHGRNIGSGFPLMVNAWNEKHWGKPELAEIPELKQTRLTLIISNEPLNKPANESVTQIHELNELLKMSY